MGEMCVRLFHINDREKTPKGFPRKCEKVMLTLFSKKFSFSDHYALNLFSANCWQRLLWESKIGHL